MGSHPLENNTYAMPKRENQQPSSWKKQRKKKNDVWQGEGEIIRESVLFERYYRLQKIVSDEEFDSFLSTLVWIPSSGHL